MEYQRRIGRVSLEGVWSIRKELVGRILAGFSHMLGGVAANRRVPSTFRITEPASEDGPISTILKDSMPKTPSID